MDEREEQNRDLWQGGPWERSGPQPGSPGAMPPRYVPPRPVLRPRRRKRRFSLPICMGLAALLISLVAISAVMESLWPVQLLPSDDGDYSYHQDYDQEELDTTPPSIPRAATGAGVTVELRPDTGETLTYTQIYDKNLPSMVSIQAENDKTYSTGTGVVLTSDGYIITNAHVMPGAAALPVACSDAPPSPTASSPPWTGMWTWAGCPWSSSRPAPPSTWATPAGPSSTNMARWWASPP